jgi:hypothetical protein
MNEEMALLRIKGVAIPTKDSSPVVVLESSDGSELAVSVGPFEAGAIVMQLEGLSTPRPLTHSLMAQLLKEQGVAVRRIELYGLYGTDQDGFLARIIYGRGFRPRTRDIRPSDALALAAVTGAPVYAHPRLLSRSLTRMMASQDSAHYWCQA